MTEKFILFKKFFIQNILKNTFLWALLLTALIPLLSALFLVNTISQNILEKQILDNLATIADKKVNDIEENVNRIKKNADLLSQDPTIINSILKLNNEKTFNEIHTYLQEVANIYEYSDIFLLSKSGEILFAVRSTYQIGHSYSKRNLPNIEFEKVFDRSKTLIETNLSNLVYTDQYNTPQLYIGAPIIENKEILGVLILQTSNKFILQAVNDSVGLGKSGETLVGTVKNKTIEPTIPLRHADIIEFLAAEKNIDKTMRDAFIGATSGEKTTGIMRDYRKKSVLAVTRLVPSMNWGMLVKIDRDEAFVPIDNLKRSIITLGALSVLGVLIVSYFVSDYLQKARNKLTRTLNELELTKNEVVEANKAKSRFLANMSHELRTPLNAVIGYSEMLEEEFQEKGLSEYIQDLNKINTAGKHLLSLINDVLDISKIEAGKMELFLSDINLKNLLSDIEAICQPLAAKKKNRFILKYPPTIGSMYTDSTKLRQCILNLVSNASKFTENGTITLNVDYFEKNQELWTRFEVIDSGIGIAPEHLERLFQAFSQVSSGSSAQGGTGLGLYLSLQFCRMMGGNINVTSKVDVGSTFTIILPVICKDETKPYFEKKITREIKISDQGATQGKNTVLMIDDNPSFHEFIDQHLGTSFRFIHTYNGKDGLEMAKLYHPDAVILDIIMPEMDGWSVLKEMKKDNSLKDIPIIISTVMADKDLGFALGVSDFINKPVNPETLFQILQKHAVNKPPLVLIVDDDEEARDYLKRILQKVGWRVNEAKNGLEALESIKHIEPSVILLDLLMPEMDGFEVVSKLQSHPLWSLIPVIVLSAKDLTSEDYNRLNGSVQKIYKKGGYEHAEFIQSLKKQIELSIQRNITFKESFKEISEMPFFEIPETYARDKKVILIIDDDEEIHASISEMLQSENYEIMHAFDGEKGYLLAQKYHPDLVIVDIIMPGFDGWQVVTRIKSNKDLTLTPIIMMSKISGEKFAYSRGVSDYLTKPVEPHMLIEQIKKNLQLSEINHILIVDDDEPIRHLLALALQKAGWKIREAKDGQEAIELISQEIPSLILLDLMMPRMDGFEVIETLQNNPEWKQIPVIVLTAQDLSQEDFKRLTLGTKKIFQKSNYRRSELLEELRDIFVNKNQKTESSSNLPKHEKETLGD